MTLRRNKRVTWARTVRSEWSKLWSLKSSWYTVGMSAVMAFVFAGVVGAAVNFGDVTKIQADPVLVILSGMNVAQILIPVLGIMMITSEYSTGTIQPTLTAVPHRLWVLWAKVAVLSFSTFPVFLVVSFLIFPIGSAFLSGTHLEVSISDPGVVRALFGASASLTLLGILGLGIGAQLRSTPAAIGTFIIALTVMPQVLPMVSSQWAESIAKYMPLKASESLMSAAAGSHHAFPGSALIALCAWAFPSVIIAGFSLTRKDV